MKPGKSKDIQSVLEKKGFVLEPKKEHHQFYYLEVDGKKQRIYIYLSHGAKEYDAKLMSIIKKQLKFKDNKLVEDFFDCPMSGKQYVEVLRGNGDL